MEYDMPLYRPPSEAYSLILQATLGCSHNRCRFCGMYKMKQFRVRKHEDFEKDALECARLAPQTTRIFLADGDAMAIRTERILKILKLLYDIFPKLERVTAYANPSNLLIKSMDDLKAIRAAGMDILYLGVESGNDEVLAKVDKGASRAEILDAGHKALDAGFPLSVTVLLGLGGREMSEAHIADTASLCSEMNPTYVSALTLMLGPFEDYFCKSMGPDFALPDKVGVLREVRGLVENLNTTDCVFRTNHASNYLPLKGVLSRDRDKLLEVIDRALENPERYLRPEFLRAL
ncbi:MAG TPA: radical SAM protein [bacterium]|nr:MAG: Oxygen-independent coproporphyrinogen-III oxidase 1 [bacterium ADurb.Bin236]HOY63076.1 radical SAM protein [bacterium]HPI77720.1 radical SAM protein [bacterium]